MEKKDLILIGMCLFAVCVLIGAMIRGFRKGFVKEVESLLSLVSALVVLRAVLSVTAGWRQKDIPGVVLLVLVILVLGFLYRIFHMLFGALHLVSKLPVIHMGNKVLGVVIGLAEGLVLVYALAYITNHYII